MRWKVPKTDIPTTYNLDDVVRGLTDYFHLLTQAGYLSPSRVRFPPPGGWTDADIAIEVIKGLGFTEAVVELCRRIPYIPHNDFHVWPDSPSLSWLRDEDNSHAKWLKDYQLRGWALDAQPFEDMPPHMVALSRSTGAAGTPWIVDTETGTMMGYLPNPEIHRAPRDQPWKAYRSYPISYFFDKAKADILTLHCVPIPAGRLTAGYEMFEGKNEPVRDRMRAIYRSHGWPDLANFQRTACIAALRAAQEDEAIWEDV